MSVVVLSLTCGVATARPAGWSVVTTAAYRYLPGDPDSGTTLTVDRGNRLLLANVDPLGAHNIVSVDVVSGMPLFSSEPVNAGQATEVTGVSVLGPGTYVFMCTVHGFDAMHGALSVI